jgi:hypothetical protein
VIAPIDALTTSTALGQVPHFVRDDGKAHARLAGPGRLDGGVEREDVGLEGDLVDRLDDPRDPLARLADRGHRPDHLGQGLVRVAHPPIDIGHEGRRAARVLGRPTVIDAISSIAADVSSSAAAWSLAPRERSWALDDTSLAADTTCCAPVRRSVAMRRMALDVPPPIVLARPSPTATDRRPIETRTLRAVAYVDSTAACTGCTVAPSAPWHRVHRGTVAPGAPWHRGTGCTVAPGAP